MDDFHWRSASILRERLYMLLAAAIALLLFDRLIALGPASVHTRLLFSAIGSAWVCFTFYRSRPREVSVKGYRIWFNNHGEHSLDGLREASLKRMFRIERVLHIDTVAAHFNCSLHGMPAIAQKRLVEVIRQRQRQYQPTGQ